MNCHVEIALACNRGRLSETVQWPPAFEGLPYSREDVAAANRSEIERLWTKTSSFARPGTEAAVWSSPCSEGERNAQGLIR